MLCFTFQEQMLRRMDPKPIIHYIAGSLTMERLYNCRPGYGIDNKKHHTCSNCCVVCHPGSYSATHESKCQGCEDSVTYGEVTCRQFGKDL
uniref:Zona-pellucida-binding protein 1/2 C-terminal domain-containing protein n=1 Tax=Eptatretus burgeri TaxID=7764 RepID=A0A8C4QFA5_EPTBU